MKHTLTAALAAIVGLACASAAPEKGDGRKHHGHPGIKQLIEKFDKDGDGKISPEEKKAIAEEMKKRFGDRRRPRPEGGKRPEGRKPRPHHDKPEGRRPHRGHDKPKRPAKKNKS